MSRRLKPSRELGDRRRLVLAREAALVALAVHLDVLLVLLAELLDLPKTNPSGTRKRGGDFGEPKSSTKKNAENKNADEILEFA